MDQKSQQRAFYTVFAFASLAAVVGGLAKHGLEGMFFALMSVLTLGGSIVCIWERSVVRSAFALMGTFLGVAGLFLMLGADFLAMAQVLIYVGGILALLLFGVMLTPPDLTERKLPRIGGAVLLVGLGVAFIASKVTAAVRVWAAVSDEPLPEPATRARDIGMAFLHPDQYVVAFELAAFLLTVALVAAVYIARRRREDFIEPEEEPA